MVIVADVEALAPRDATGDPKAVTFQRLLRDALHARVAVVCTTSRPESVDPALRSPGLLDHELAVPLPDAGLRREQLGVLTRRMPLAADVRLDEVAARTPGFVAADLAALVREAGVRAALRQKDTRRPPPRCPAPTSRRRWKWCGPPRWASSTVDIAAVTLDDVGDMVEVKEVLTESVLWPLTYPDTFARLGVQPPRGVLLYGPPGCGKTFLVKAIAGTGQANVLSVKGAELLSQMGRRERTGGPRTVPPGPGGRADAGLPGRGGRARADPGAGHRRGYHRPGGGRAADRAGRGGVAAQRRGDRRHQPARPGRPGAAAPRAAGAAGVRTAAGRGGPRRDPARRRPDGPAGRRRRPDRGSPPTWTASRPPTARR